MYPGAGEDAINLLTQILVFNPYFRMTVEEALAHPLFKKIRKSEKEVSADIKIEVEFEKEVLDKKKLRQLFLEEIQYYKTKKAAVK